MKQLILLILLPVLLFAQVEWADNAEIGTLVVDISRTEVKVYQDWKKDKDKVTFKTEKELSLFDEEYYKYKKVNPVLDEKKLEKEIKKQQQKTIQFIQKNKRVYCCRNIKTNDIKCFDFTLSTNKFIKDTIDQFYAGFGGLWVWKLE